MRIDPGSHYYFGFRLNFFVSLGVFLASTCFFIWWQVIRTGQLGRSASASI